MLKSMYRYAAPLAYAWLLFQPVAHAAEEKPVAAATQATLAFPFDQYQAWRDEPLQDWREANDRVEVVGGWRTYLREAQQEKDGAGTGHHQH